MEENVYTSWEFLIAVVIAVNFGGMILLDMLFQWLRERKSSSDRRRSRIDAEIGGKGGGVMETCYCGKCRLDWVPDRYVATEHGLKPECPVCELRAQLAAQAAAVEVLGAIHKMLGDGWRVELEALQNGLTGKATCEDEWHAVTGRFDFNEAIIELAALVAAAGNEEGK